MARAVREVLSIFSLQLQYVEFTASPSSYFFLAPGLASYSTPTQPETLIEFSLPPPEQIMEQTIRITRAKVCRILLIYLVIFSTRFLFHLTHF